LTLLVATPLGFLLSLIGVIMNQDRRAGVVGMVITGAMVALFFGATLCR
jgi:hypothetical protein